MCSNIECYTKLLPLQGALLTASVHRCCPGLRAFGLSARSRTTCNVLFYARPFDYCAHSTVARIFFDVSLGTNIIFALCFVCHFLETTSLFTIECWYCFYWLSHNPSDFSSSINSSKSVALPVLSYSASMASILSAASSSLAGCQPTGIGCSSGNVYHFFFISSFLYSFLLNCLIRYLGLLLISHKSTKMTRSLASS